MKPIPEVVRSRLLKAAAILATGLAASMQGAAQAPAAQYDAAQRRLIRQYESFLLGRIDEFIAEAEKARANNPSPDAYSPRLLALAYGADGRPKEAFAEIERAFAAPGISLAAKFDLAVAGHLTAMGVHDREKLVYWLTEMGKIDTANQPTFNSMISRLDDPAAMLARQQERLRDPAATEAQLGNLAPWLAYLGDAEGALEALRIERMTAGFRGQVSLWSAVFHDVRKLPGFKQLVQDMGLVDEWRRSDWSDYCKPVGKDDFDCGSGAAGKAVSTGVDEWRQIRAHRTRRVEVDKDVFLEVVDWGGTGRPLVLLAGMGNNAHVFDSMAPKLTDQYHVYGITRRGYGASSAPLTGYESDRLGDDVLAVLDALQLERPVLAGHSLAGTELSSIGSRFPERVAGLIYIDAAYTYAFHEPEYEAVQRAQLAAEKARITGPLAPPELIEWAILDARHHGYTKVSPPLLAIIAGQMGRSEAADAARTSIVQAQIKAIMAAAPHARLLYLPLAPHFVFTANEAEVVTQIRAFIATLK